MDIQQQPKLKNLLFKIRHIICTQILYIKQVMVYENERNYFVGRKDK
jgi:hypothetical protein